MVSSGQTSCCSCRSVRGVIGWAETSDRAGAGLRDEAEVGLGDHPDHGGSRPWEGGRRGARWVRRGVAASGPVDPASLTLANRLAGNDEYAAALEVTLGGLQAVLSTGRYVAVTGGAARCTSTACPSATRPQIFVPRGSILRLGTSIAGLRTYVAVAEGTDSPWYWGRPRTTRWVAWARRRSVTEPCSHSAAPAPFPRRPSSSHSAD